MASTINASSTANGIVSTADASGILNIQSNGVNTNTQAWVNFNGVTTVTIRASYNVSSVTRVSTGVYTVNFTNALIDTNYCAINSSGGTLSILGAVSYENNTARTTTSFTFYAYNTSLVLADAAYCNVAVFR